MEITNEILKKAEKLQSEMHDLVDSAAKLDPERAKRVSYQSMYNSLLLIKIATLEEKLEKLCQQHS